MPVYALIALFVVAVAVGVVCAWRGARFDREIDGVLPLAVSEDIPHPPP